MMAKGSSLCTRIEEGVVEPLPAAAHVARHGDEGVLAVPRHGDEGDLHTLAAIDRETVLVLGVAQKPHSSRNSSDAEV